jgi:hypothetical protein
MPRLFHSRWTPLSRLALMAALALLLCAQFLLLAHAGEHAHHRGDGDEPVCASCLLQASGHPVVGPLSESGLVALRPWPRVQPQPRPARLRLQPGWPLQPAARGPPTLRPRA